MKFIEETNNESSRYKLTIELSEADMIGIEMDKNYKKFIHKKLSQKGITSKLWGLIALIAKIEEKEIIN